MFICRCVKFILLLHTTLIIGVAAASGAFNAL